MFTIEYFSALPIAPRLLKTRAPQAPVHSDRLADVLAAEQAVVAAEDQGSPGADPARADAARFTARELKTALKPAAAPPALPVRLRCRQA